MSKDEKFEDLISEVKRKRELYKRGRKLKDQGIIYMPYMMAENVDVIDTMDSDSIKKLSISSRYSLTTINKNYK